MIIILTIVWSLDSTKDPKAFDKVGPIIKLNDFLNTCYTYCIRINIFTGLTNTSIIVNGKSGINIFMNVIKASIEYCILLCHDGLNNRM